MKSVGEQSHFLHGVAFQFDDRFDCGVSVGQKVKEGETLLTLEAMKMFAAVASPSAGTVREICVKISESVESKDLLVRLVK